MSKNPLALTDFYEIISGKLKADKGTYEWGTTVTHAYLPNDNSQFFLDKKHQPDGLAPPGLFRHT
ncbi:MAG: hypothetical protein WDM78_02370 [Puia sp.]